MPLPRRKVKSPYRPSQKLLDSKESERFLQSSSKVRPPSRCARHRDAGARARCSGRLPLQVSRPWLAAVPLARRPSRGRPGVCSSCATTEQPGGWPDEAPSSSPPHTRIPHTAYPHTTYRIPMWHARRELAL